MEEASGQHASSYGDDGVASSERGHVLSLRSDRDLKFKEAYYDKIYNRKISKLVDDCLNLFARQMNQEISPSAFDQPETTVESQKEIAKFITSMNTSFKYWFIETCALASQLIHGLDSLFNEYKDMKVMVAGTLEVLIEDLTEVISGRTDRLYTEYGVLEGIKAGIKDLYQMINMIREASERNDCLNLDMISSSENTTEVKNHMFPIIRRMFPHARLSLCHQLALSVAIRRIRLRRTFKDAEWLKARRARDQVNTHQMYQDFDMAYSGVSIESGFSTNIVESSVRPFACKYPPRFPFPPEVTNGICSYCAQRMNPSIMRRRPEIWEHHANGDVKPFVCLSEECCSPVLFFASMEHWIDHMNKSHSHEWTRRIHPGAWICNTGHEAIEFEDVESFRKHMNDKDSHPITPDEQGLRVLELTQLRYRPRDRFSCPCCDFTLDRPKQTISTDFQEESPYHPLHEHIAGHLKDLAMLSLPILETSKAPEALPDNDEDKENRNWLRQSSKSLRPRRYNQEFCGIFVPGVQRSSHLCQGHDLMQSEPEYLTSSIRNGFDEEFGARFSTLQVYTAYGT